MRDFPLLSRLFVNEARTLTDITRGCCPRVSPCKKIDSFRRPLPLNDALKFIENKFTGRHTHKEGYLLVGEIYFEFVVQFKGLTAY